MDAAPTDLRDAAALRLKGLLALVRGTPGWLTPRDFVEDPVMPVTSLDSARQLAKVVRELCGTTLEMAPAPDNGDPAYAAVLASGPRGTVLVGCRVEPLHPHRIDELVLLPSVGRPGAVPLPPSTTVTVVGEGDAVADKMETFLDAARTDLGLVGVVAAVYQGATPLWTGAAGGPDPDHAVVRVGSITKTMLTVRSLQLVEQGVFGLRDRVGDLLSSWSIDGPHAGELEVQHLLSHTGAAREVPEDRFFVPQHGPEPDLADWLDNPVEILGVPGDGWAYSNVGMTLLGQIIGDVTGRSFEEDVQEHVFAPLGMSDTAFRLPASRRGAVMPGFAEGFEGVAAVEPVHVGARAAGSVFSTVADMGRWAGEVAAGVNGSGVLLTPQSWRDCLTPVTSIPGTGMSMARGFLRVDDPDDPDDPVVWHNGALPGASAQLWVAPRSGLSLALFANVWSPWRTMLLERRCLRVLRDLAGTTG